MVVYQRFQLQGFDLESFGVLDSYRLSLMGGGCTWRFDGNNSNNNIIIIIIIMIMRIVICELCHPGGGGGTPIYGLYTGTCRGIGYGF